LKQYVEVSKGEPARQTELARAAAFDHIAAERFFAFDFAARLCRSGVSAVAVEALMNDAG